MRTALFNFTHSIWAAAPIMAGVYVIAYFMAQKLIGEGDFYYFDAKHNRDYRLADAGDFGSHSQRYQDLAKLLVTLSSAAIAFLVGTLVSPIKTESAVRLSAAAPVVVGFFGCCIALELCFMFSQTAFYEAYSHSPTHSTYTRRKYAFCTACGWSGLIAFLLGFAWLALKFFSRS